jgi:hypothetical protein
MEPTQRIRVPRYAPNPDIARLRAAGWTLAQIAGTLPASLRETYRWAAGDARPLAVYAERLAAIEGPPPVAG